MVMTPSKMVALGQSCIDFDGTDTRDGQTVNCFSYKDNRPLLLAFICNHCPFVTHIIERLVAVAADFEARGGAVLFVSSNDVLAYPEDSPQNMQRFAQQYGIGWPYMYDESQAIARAYQAQCTPDFYLYDSAGSLVYRGRFDASTPGNGQAVTGGDLAQACRDVLLGNEISHDQFPSVGCNIKWLTSA